MLEFLKCTKHKSSLEGTINLHAYLMPDVSIDRLLYKSTLSSSRVSLGLGVEGTSHFLHKAALAGKVAQQPIY